MSSVVGSESNVDEKFKNNKILCLQQITRKSDYVLCSPQRYLETVCGCTATRGVCSFGFSHLFVWSPQKTAQPWKGPKTTKPTSHVIHPPSPVECALAARSVRTDSVATPRVAHRGRIPAAVGSVVEGRGISRRNLYRARARPHSCHTASPISYTEPKRAAPLDDDDDDVDNDGDDHDDDCDCKRGGVRVRHCLVGSDDGRKRVRNVCETLSHVIRSERVWSGFEAWLQKGKWRFYKKGAQNLMVGKCSQQEQVQNF